MSMDKKDASEKMALTESIKVTATPAGGVGDKECHHPLGFHENTKPVR